MNSRLLAQDLDWTLVGNEYQNITNINPSNYVAAFIQLGLGIIATVSLIFLLIGGYRWITSKGEKEGLAKSQKTISGAIIGLIIALALFLILGLLSVFTRTNLFQFCIPVVGGPGCNIQYANPFNDSGGGEPVIPGDPSLATGDADCPSCGSSGCGIVGETYIGPVTYNPDGTVLYPNTCYQCTEDRWVSLNSDCSGITSPPCGTCP